MPSLQADLLVSTDALETFLEAGDQGFEEPEPIFSMGTSFNTGVTLLPCPLSLFLPHDIRQYWRYVCLASV